MAESLVEAGALRDLLVLELGDEGTQYCGKLLADMGARVIKIEPPGGCNARLRGPFKDDKPDPNCSLYYWAYNTSKESMVLDLTKEADRRKVRRLSKKADVILEDSKPGYLDSLKLGYAQLSRQNPGLVYASITPFGQTGPLKDWKGSDLVNLAMGGIVWLVGYEDRSTPPLSPEGDHSLLMGGQWAFMGIMAALVSRDVIGEGQQVDVSIQEACSFCTEWSVPDFEYQGVITRRHNYMIGQLLCKDGRYLLPQMTNVTPERWARFTGWLRENGAGEELTGEEFLNARFFQANFSKVLNAIERVAATKTAGELAIVGQGMGFTWGVFNAPEDLLEDEQLKYRGYFQKIYHPEHNASYTYAGPPYEWSEAPWRIRRRPPLLGEDNNKLAELLSD